MANCFSMVICSDQLLQAVMLVSIIYKCVITGRQMTLPPSSLSWYSSLFCRMTLVQINFQGSLKAHRLNIKNSFSLLCPQREWGNIQQHGLFQHHGQSDHPLGCYWGFWVLSTSWVLLPLYTLPPTHTHILFSELIHFSPLRPTAPDIRIPWLFTFWILVVWSWQLLSPVLILPFFSIPPNVLHLPQYMSQVSLFVCSYHGCCFYPAGLPESWNLFLLLY